MGRPHMVKNDIQPLVLPVYVFPLAQLDDKVLNAVVRRTEAIGQASVSAEPLHTYKPSSTAINDYKNLAR